jgi:hypothetical protein
MLAVNYEIYFERRYSLLRMIVGRKIEIPYDELTY